MAGPAASTRATAAPTRSRPWRVSRPRRGTSVRLGSSSSTGGRGPKKAASSSSCCPLSSPVGGRGRVSCRAHAARLVALALLAGTLVTLAYRRPFDYRIDVGADDASYVEGFQERQRLGGVDWRGSADRARLHFHNAGQLVGRPRLRLRLGAMAAGGAAALPVSLALNDRPVAVFDAPGALTQRQFPIDPSDLGPGDWILSISTPVAERRG